ncbi:Smr/MutS family protein [Sediminitomix flava]|uniref:Smr domain-containing protein n=1 Tax=Sediminitomix flava TaxID=379075 RepID=A0A315Z8H5_SEDFL|nr:DUF2027 domain-containing protein [Sediminitomix flava]PWJ40235.1 Smr domain-containing protein [Sediminitomix flava]
MNIGDRVRHMHAPEEGIVVKFISDKEVEVEIEDGFRIPYLIGELVVVSKYEEAAFGSAKQDADHDSDKSIPTPKVLVSEKGIFIAFSHENDKLLSVYLINNTDLAIPFTFGTESSKIYEGVFTGGLSPKSSKKIHEVNLDNFESWPYFIVQALLFKSGFTALREPLVKKLKFRANSFFKQKKDIPLMDKQGYVFQIDTDEVKPLEIKTDVIKESLYTNAEGGHSLAMPPKPKEEIDLHAEALGLDASAVGKDNLLSLQILEFEKQLDAAIVNGMDEITFIHGIGNGSLKLELHRRLAKHPDVLFYKEAKKEKFGFGATAVKIK